MAPAEKADLGLRIVAALIPPLLLIMSVLGSIVAGVATPTESVSVGAVGALFPAAVKLSADAYLGAKGDPRRGTRLFRVWLVALAGLLITAWFFGAAGLLNTMLVLLALALVVILVRRDLRRSSVLTLFRSSISTMSITSMVFIILLGATAFALVFTQLGGRAMVLGFLERMPGGQFGAVFVVFLIILGLGFFLESYEIIVIVIPITAPVLLMMGVDPIWQGGSFAWCC